MKEKNIQIDNLKAILIVLVVVGHFGSTKNPFYRSLIAFIYSFHMPLFLFVSGYLSKNLDRIRDKAVTEYLFLFMAAQFIWTMTKYIVFDDPYYLSNVLEPGFGLWYLLCIFVYRILLKDLVKIRYLLLISVALSIGVMAFSNLDHVFDIQRMLGFFFYFLLGYLVTEEKIKKIQKIPWLFAAGILMIGYLGFYLIIRNGILSYSELTKLLQHQLLLHDVSSIWKGIILYILAGGFAFVFGVMVIRLVPSKKNMLTYLGVDTLPLYLSHTYVVLFYRELVKEHILESVFEIPMLLFLSLVSILFFSTSMYRRQFHSLKAVLEKAIQIDR